MIANMHMSMYMPTELAIGMLTAMTITTMTMITATGMIIITMGMITMTAIVMARLRNTLMR